MKLFHAHPPSQLDCQTLSFKMLGELPTSPVFSALKQVFFKHFDFQFKLVEKLVRHVVVVGRL